MYPLFSELFSHWSSSFFSEKNMFVYLSREKEVMVYDCEKNKTTSIMKNETFVSVLWNLYLINNCRCSPFGSSLIKFLKVSWRVEQQLIQNYFAFQRHHDTEKYWVSEDLKYVLIAKDVQKVFFLLFHLNAVTISFFRTPFEFLSSADEQYSISFKEFSATKMN